jgi:hypothetical protein
LELGRDFKRLMEELGQAINESLSDSDRIGEVMNKIKAAGYDLFLVLEVTIGFNKRGEGDVIHRQKIGGRRGKVQFTTEDARFLRALRITLEEREPD